MTNPQLNLVVIRSMDVETSAAFYHSLGIDLVKHSHPPCGEHYASTGEGCLFEIYPAHPEQASSRLTIGFAVDSLEATLQRVAECGGSVKRHPAKTAWGMSATLIDPDGNTVLLSSTS